MNTCKFFRSYNTRQCSLTAQNGVVSHNFQGAYDEKEQESERRRKDVEKLNLDVNRFQEEMAAKKVVHTANVNPILRCQYSTGL